MNVCLTYLNLKDGVGKATISHKIRDNAVGLMYYIHISHNFPIRLELLSHFH